MCFLPGRGNRQCLGLFRISFCRIFLGEVLFNVRLLLVNRFARLMGVLAPRVVGMLLVTPHSTRCNAKNMITKIEALWKNMLARVLGICGDLCEYVACLQRCSCARRMFCSMLLWKA